MKIKIRKIDRAAARSVVALCLIIFTCLAVIAQSGGSFVIKRSVIAGGGGNTTGSVFTMDGTVGQPYGTGSATGGTFSLGSGFWAGGVANASPSPTPAISGTVTYANAIGAPTLRFVSNVLLTGAGSPNVMATTGAPGPTEGQYVLTGFGAGSYTVTPTKTGGVNAITSFDAAKIAQHVAAISTLTGNQLVVADVSGNGNVTSFDAGQIARYVTAAPPFGSTGTWRFAPVNRAYGSVNSNITGEDYGALLMGEVSGNWNNTGARPVTSRQLAEGSWQELGSGESEEIIIVKLPQRTAITGSETSLSIGVEGIANKNVIAYEFDLRYDHSVMQPVPNSVDLAATVSRGLTAVVNAEEPGLLRVAVYGAKPIVADGVLLNLRFRVVGVPGWVSPLIWQRVMFNEGERTTAAEGRIELVDTH